MTPGGGPPAGADDWMALVEQTLRGRDLAELASTTRDGVEILPLYTDGPDRPAAVVATGPGRSEAGWDIRQRHRVIAATAGTFDGLRGEIAQDLESGVNSLELDVAAGVDADALDSLLQGVDITATPIALAPHADVAAAEALVAVAEGRNGVLAAGSTFGLDPVGEWARSGRIADPSFVAGWAAQAAESGSASPGIRFFAVDAVRYADAGATEAQTLGWATATGIAYLRELVEAGISVDAAAGLVGFRLPATADQFVTIAALRAARVMWARVVTASGGSQEAARQYQHVVTASHMYSRRDPWVNLLRGSAAALAAGVAGADAVTVLPFDNASRPARTDAALGHRLARNTQLLLLEESHLARSSDPAGGSFYVESLTEQLAAEGWRALQDAEASGGMADVIDGGGLVAEIKESWRSRLGGLRTRSECVTGVSEFALLDEAVPAALAEDEGGVESAGLPVRRLAEPFEALRGAADRHRMSTGERSRVWLTALGKPSDHSARTVWAQSLLTAGGIEPRGGVGVDSPIAAAADFAASGLSAAVITGTDDMYRLRGSATAHALAEAGAVFVALVCDPGTPAELLSELESSGVDEAWHDGIDAAAALERIHRVLGIV